MRRIADLHPGQSKTDARDAHVIADAARTMPHTLRRIRGDDETLAELSVLAGDDDPAGQSTRLTNRLRDALLHVHPALERLLGPRLDRAGILDLLAAAPTPAALAELARGGRVSIPLRRGGGGGRLVHIAMAARYVSRAGTAPCWADAALAEVPVHALHIQLRHCAPR